MTRDARAGLALPWDTSGLLVAVDTETTGLHPDPPENARVSVVSLAWRDWSEHFIRPARAMALPFEFGRGTGGQATLDLEPDPNLGPEEWRVLMEWLARQRLVFQGGSFDLMMLHAGTARFEGSSLEDAWYWDTIIGSRELDPAESAELGDIERRLNILGTQERADWLNSKKLRARVNLMEWARAAEYATVDAVVTLHAAEHQLARFGQGEGSRASMDRLLAQGRELLRIERRGVGYDRQRSLEIAEQMKKVESSMRVGLPFRATPAGAKRYFFTERGYDPAERTATGQPRLDDQEVSRLVALGAPFAREYQELRSIEVARTKWYESYAEHCGWDGRLRTKFSQAKVISGRLSSTRVNLQAIPHDYQLKEITERGWETPRQLFRARDGARLWELDLSQAELRVAAVEAGCTSMLELIREGADIHGSVTSDLFNIQPEHPDWGEKRQIGKRADFAFIFGVGADTFQFDLAKLTGIWLPIGECQSIVAKWRKLFPEYGRAIKRYMDLADRRQWIRLVNGRVRHFASWEDQHKAFNQYVQGSLAELMTDWLIEVGKRWPGLVLLTIHDSLVLETADEALVQEVRQLGEELGTKMFKVPMVVDMKVWGE